MTSTTHVARALVALTLIAGLVGACASTAISPGPTPPAFASSLPSPGSSSTASPGPEPSSGGATAAPATAPPPTPVGSSVDAAPCGPEDVKLRVAGEGATGAVLLIIDVQNTGAAPCVLAGAPASIALRAGGGSLPTTYAARQDPWPGDSPDAVAPPVVLPPGWTGRARAIWRNWCLGPADVSTVWVGFGSEALDTSPDPFIPPPRCDNQAAESTIQGYPFQEDTTGG